MKIDLICTDLSYSTSNDLWRKASYNNSSKVYYIAEILEKSNDYLELGDNAHMFCSVDQVLFRFIAVSAKTVSLLLKMLKVTIAKNIEAMSELESQSLLVLRDCWNSRRSSKQSLTRQHGHSFCAILSMKNAWKSYGFTSEL